MLPVRAALAATALTAALSITGANAAERCPAPQETRTTEFGVLRPLGDRLQVKTGGGERAPYNGSDQGANPPFKAAYYRFRIVPISLPADGEWTLTLRDQAERVQQVLTASDFEGAQMGGPGVWTRFLKADEIKLDLYSPPGTLLISRSSRP